MKYYGPDGTEYASLSEAQAAGVANPTTTKPVAAPKPANIPTYGYELSRLMQQYGVNSPVAPRTNDQSLINQYFKKLEAPMYQTPSGNGLFDQYLNIGLGNIAAPTGPMTRFFPGQAVAPSGFRYDPVTNTNVSVTDPAGAASGRITTGTPNIGGNQCPPNFNFDPVSRSCVPTVDTGLLTGGQSQSEKQPMPTCPPNTTLDPVNRICVPKGCPAGYEADASGNCVAKSMQVPCPPGFSRDATGVCIPIPTNEQQKPCPDGSVRSYTGECVPVVTPTPCPSGYVRSATGECVPDPEQLALFNKYYQSPQAGEYDIYNAMSKGNLSENLVRDLVSQRGGENVDEWLAKNVDPDKTFSAYAIQNLAAQGRPDDPNVANRGTQSGENRVFDLYQQGAIGLNEIEDAMGKENVKDWMRAYRPDTYQQVYGFAKGGSVGLDGMMKKYQVGGSNRITDFNSMLGQAPAARSAMIGQPPMRDDGLNQMMQQYNVGRTSNSRQDYDQASERLKQAMMSASEATPVAAGPSKAEMYFRLASAFAKPTPTGNFFESLGNATGELAAYKGDVRAAESAAAQQRRDLAIELAKADVTRARDIMEMESESGLPISPEGKAAYDEGLIPGTPEFAARAREIKEQTNLARLTAANAAPARMSTTEARAKLDAEREVLQSEIAIDAINKAIALSETAYTKSIPDQILYAQAKIINPDNERVVATQLMEQLVTTNLLSSLKSMFGGNVTEGERLIALATQGLESKSVEARDESFKELLGYANRRNTYLTSLIERINSREFMQYEDFVAPESTELTAGQETGVI
jgi:hypothetical protein